MTKEIGLKAPPSIVKYSDYRLYLADYYEYKKRLRPGFSFRKFSAMAGFKSPNYLQLVIKGERRFSDEAAMAVAEALKLSKSESEVFRALVKQDLAETDSERDEAESLRLASIKRILAKEIPAAQKEILSRWYHLLVRELTFLPEFEPTGDFISKRLNGLISEEQGEESIRLLVRAGFLKSENGKLVPTDPVVDTGDEVFLHGFMQRHHSETLKVWSQNLDRFSPIDQELGLLNIPISSDKIPELKKRIRKFQDEIIGWVQSESNADRVVQLGTYLIPYDKED